jgi:hypothetical protein
MSLNDLANIGQVIGAIAVVISLIYVAMQIRQNTNAVRSGTAQTVHEHFAKWYHLVAADDELSQIVATGLRDYGSLSEKDRVRFYCGLHGVLVLLAKCISEVAGGTPCVTTVAGLGACHHEPRLRAWWQGILERPGLHVWR